jgi:hypothetical protein
MTDTTNRGCVFSAPNTVEKDTGLSDYEQRERATVARLWFWRIAWLMDVSGCTARDAVRAVELSDKEHRS